MAKTVILDELLLMAIFLMTPELGTLGRFLILRKPTDPPPLDTPNFGRKWMQSVRSPCRF